MIADSFGNGAFEIEFVSIASPGNAPDTTGYGAVDHEYRISKHEVSRGMIEHYNSLSGGEAIVMTDLSAAGGNGPDRPAVGVSWNEAARFINWLNTSEGHSPAYKFTASDITANIELWTAGDAGYDVANPFRNSNARYFLPSEDEWYKAAYYDPSANGATGGYWDYATGSDTAPVTSSGGTSSGTAVYRDGVNTNPNIPANVTEAGGLSPLGTMAQNGNAAELIESAYFGSNNDPAAIRALRDGTWQSNEVDLRSTSRSLQGTGSSGYGVGFRVASIVTEAPASILFLNPVRSGTIVTADIESTVGSVDIYRTIDLINFGTAPVASDLPPGVGVVIDPNATPEQAFYLAVPHGVALP